jgi:hypothetical protein
MKRLKYWNTHLQHSSKKQLKHLEHTLAAYMYSHYNKCNILIYFCNIQIKHMQHPDKTYETLETFACNMRFQRNVTLVLGRMKARHREARRA